MSTSLGFDLFATSISARGKIFTLRKTLLPHTVVTSTTMENRLSTKESILTRNQRLTPHVGPTLNFRSDLLPASSALVRERSGSTPPRPPTLALLTLVNLSASWLTAVSSSASLRLATPEPVLALTRRPSATVDTLATVRERVLLTPECPLRFSG